jgi:hypothetical protein
MKRLLNPQSWAPAILAWSYLLLLPFGHAFELPTLVMAILGGMLAWKHGKPFTCTAGAKTLGILFLCIWIPIVLSIPGSLDVRSTLTPALTFPRIYFAGLYLLWILRDSLVRQRLFKLSAWLMMVWIVDALIQAAIGYDLLGYAYPTRLNGLFGTHSWKLGLTLAMLSPLLWEYASRHGSKGQLVLAWAGSAAVVLLASNRESWIMFALATLLWGWVYAQRLGFHPAKLLAPLTLVAVFAGIGAYQLNPKFSARVDQSKAALSFNYTGLEAASSMRVHLWNNAFTAALDHPVNGVGVSGYKYAYALYAEKNDPWVNPDGTGMLYAHQLLLEVASETGGIGLVGLLVYFVVLLRASRGVSAHPLAWAAWLGAFAWLFPLNTHTSFYSAHWSVLLGWLIAVSLARDDQSLALRPPSTAST